MNSLFYERTGESRLGVRVGIPCLLLDCQRRLGEQRLEPSGQVRADVVPLVGELAASSRAIGIRFVYQDFNAGLGTLGRKIVLSDHINTSS